MSDPVAERRAGLRERLLELAEALPCTDWIDTYDDQHFNEALATLREAAHALEASSEAPQAGPVVNGGGSHYDNPATWAKEASPTVDLIASLQRERDELKAERDDLKAEHQCCLDGDEGWAEQWKRRAEAAEQALSALREALLAIQSQCAGHSDEFSLHVYRIAGRVLLSSDPSDPKS